MSNTVGNDRGKSNNTMIVYVPYRPALSFELALPNNQSFFRSVLRSKEFLDRQVFALSDQREFAYQYGTGTGTGRQCTNKRYNYE